MKSICEVRTRYGDFNFTSSDPFLNERMFVEIVFSDITMSVNHRNTFKSCDYNFVMTDNFKKVRFLSSVTRRFVIL